jgi:hypothetical protein
MMVDTTLGDHIVSRLEDSPDWLHHSYCMEGTVSLGFPGTRLLLQIDHAKVSWTEDDTSPARVQISGEASGWDRLGDPTAVNATLNRLFREGDLDVQGDMDFAMHHWAGLFWIVGAVGAALAARR